MALTGWIVVAVYSIDNVLYDLATFVHDNVVTVLYCAVTRVGRCCQAVQMRKVNKVLLILDFRLKIRTNLFRKR